MMLADPKLLVDAVFLMKVTSTYEVSNYVFPWRKILLTQGILKDSVRQGMSVS